MTATRLIAGTLLLALAACSGAVAHNVAFDDRSATTPDDIARANANVPITPTLNAAGNSNYRCNIHPDMAGVVVVHVSQAL